MAKREAKKLTIRRETIRALTTEELRLAAGGFRSCVCQR
jgi:formate-dependent phosphoribosylglycinamide formyltransferase (GAR transformylase)